MLVVVAINGWHLHQLTEQVSKQLGESAFSVSKATVESMLSQQLTRNLTLFGNFTEQQAFPLRKTINIISNKAIEQSVELQLQDQQSSRFIRLKQNNKSFDIPIPRTKVETLLSSVKTQVISSSLLILALSLLFFYWLTQKLTKPLNTIIATSTKIGEGQFGTQVNILHRVPGVELNQLICSINKMSVHLNDLEKQKQILQEQKTTHEVSEIARGLAHSIRNPLHTISLSLDVKSENNEEFEALNQRIKTQINRIDRHLKNLMVITTHESLNSEVIDIKQLIKTIINELSIQYPSQDVVFHCDKNNDYTIGGLTSELHTVINTIMTNALEASDKSERVTIELNQQNDGLIIRISDLGIGLDKNIKQKLFTPHNTNKPYGAGMGLYLSNRIVKGRYSGFIEYTENKPKGSVFLIALHNRTK